MSEPQDPPRGALTLVIVIIAVLLLAMMEHDKRELTKERDALLVEKSEWQRAAMPAIRADGGTEYKAEDVTPKDLASALNPCVPLGSSGGLVYGTPECDKAFGDARSYGSRGIPIKILLDTSPPR